MKTYAQVKTFLRNVLDTTGHERYSIYPGPELPDIPGEFIVATVYGGPGLALDGIEDDVGWQFRTVGNQNDYEGAESAANAIDIACISHRSDELIAGVHVSEIRRVGGAPTALTTDQAERTHFVCSYVASVELALPN